MRPEPRTLVALLLAAATLAAPGRPRAEPATRGGLFAGFGMGWSSASWSWPDGQRRGEWSGSVALRAGTALQTELLVGVEAWAWANQYQIETSAAPVPVEATLGAATVAATYFPGNAGFFLRAGLGLAYGRVDVHPPAGADFAASGETRDTGLALAGALGYEMRLTSKFALAAEVDAVYMDVTGEAIGDVFGYGIGVEFNWYW